MKLEYIPQEQLKTMVKQAVEKHLSLSSYRLFFFGSRVRGDSGERSDIDIGIEGPKEIPIKVKLAIEEELEDLPTLYRLELVDFQTVTERFKKEAHKYSELIN